MDKVNSHKGSGHRKRLREKFLESGLDGFHDYEVIELLLTIGTPRKDCKEQAKLAINEFEDFQGVINASTESLCKIKGIGPVNVYGIKLIKAVADRYLRKKFLQSDPISNSDDLKEYLRLTLREKKNEVFKVIYLDAKNRVINSEILFSGSVTSSAVYPREVVQGALKNNAVSLIFAHNHPSGDPEPSPEDISITRKLFLACKVVGITVHEHMIIGGDNFYSFSEHGLISRFLRESQEI